jgi:stage III sporulation protein AH
MKINKKQILMLTLSLLVCVAVFVNWRFISQGEYDTVQTSNEENVEENNSVTDENSQTKTLGEAQYVSSAANSVEEYFTNSRLTRKQSKDEAIELLKTVISNENSSEDAILKANAEISAIASKTELEGTVENLIKAKGFEDCVVFISSDLVNVVVHTDGLDSSQAAQINEIVVTQTGISSSNIKIVEVK